MSIPVRRASRKSIACVTSLSTWRFTQVTPRVSYPFAPSLDREAPPGNRSLEGFAIIE